MMDIEIFLTTLYVIVDDYCKSQLPAEAMHPGPQTTLSRSEVVTLTLFGQWRHFVSERDFYRYARTHLRFAFPGLPDRTQFNRLLREHRGAGWLAGQAGIGWSNRLGWYEGMQRLAAIRPDGLITGLGLAPASTNDHTPAETFLAVRHQPTSRLGSRGSPTGDYYVADKGFAGANVLKQWWHCYRACVVCSPHQKSKRARWSKALRRWLASLRQIIETIYDKLLNTFRLARERPHTVTGLQARLAAKVALHNFRLWLNRQRGREPVPFAALLDW